MKLVYLKAANRLLFAAFFYATIKKFIESFI